jgi:N-acetylglucosamine-6-sulfatase
VTRRLSILTRVVAVLLLGTLLSATFLPPHPALAASRNNIILVNIDDLDADSLRFMPNVESLVTRNGATFTDFIVAAPDCCPSRASLLRGQYVHDHGILRGSRKFGEGKFRSQGLEDSTIATWLRRAGYRTALVGKYLNGYEVDPTHVPPGWTEWYATFSNRYFDYRINENGKLVRYGSEAADHQTDVLSQKSVSIIRRSAKAGKPFFLYLTPSAPHGPATPAPRHESLFADATAPRTASFNEEDVSDKPKYIRDTSALTQTDIDAIDERYRDRLRALQAVDETVARIVTKLRDTGTLSTTYIFFTSDNGYLLGQHRQTDKGVPYEEAITVPLLVRGPGITAGRRIDQLTSNIDLAPTIADLAGASIPRFVSGRSLVPLLRGSPPQVWRKAAISEFYREGNGDPGELSTEAVLEQPGSPSFLALRTENRSYVEYVTGERELYDLANDPHQLQNLASDPDYAAEVDRFHAWLEAFRACSGRACRTVENQSPG